ncbi:MAG: FecR domain-containing protein [Planctomycetota bacterium]|nr:FecR domain-containing protein [Planctomycetota bacterium]
MNRRPTHEDLVALALGALGRDEASAVREQADEAELAAVERHLELHDRVPRLTAESRLWRSIEAEIEAEPLAAQPLWRRYWMPLAAAALVMVALFMPNRGPEVTTVHGDVARAGDRYTAATVARLRLDTGTVITMDAGTQIRLLGSKRLALGAGRVHLQVPPRTGHGFVVVTDSGLSVTTLGTTFSVERGPRVGVTTGAVAVRWNDAEARVAGGESWTPQGLAAGGANRSWFSRPSLVARIEDDAFFTVTVKNTMPDSIQLAPPTGGEPFFFVRVGDDTPVPVEPESNPCPNGPRTLDRNDSFELRMRLPRSLEDREAFFVSCPNWGVTAEVKRR